MKCYTWHLGKMTSGIQVEADKFLGMIVSLGMEGGGSGRLHEKVELYRKNPPDIENGFIYKAYPVKITSNYYMLAKPDSTDDPRVLIRIKTRWIYTRESYGKWETIAGTPQNLMIGSGVHGLIARSKAEWYEGLVLFAPGDAVCITPEGANEIERYVLLCTENGIHHLSFSDYRSQIANKREAVYI